MKIPFLFTIAFVFTSSSLIHAQNASPDSTKVYRVSWLLDGGITLAATASFGWGSSRNGSKAPLTQAELGALSPADVNAFDRVALRQDPGRRDMVGNASNALLIVTAAMPTLLLIDRDIRSDWLRFGLLYVETQSLNSSLQAWAPFGPALVDRIRPRAYYSDIPIDERTPGTNRNSFYSGHATMTACASFFMAKVLADYHPEWGGRRWLLYGAALAPPAVVGYLRVRAVRHFPTDVIVGGLIGGAMGFLIPELHRVKGGRLGVSAVYSDQMKGLSARWRI